MGPYHEKLIDLQSIRFYGIVRLQKLNETTQNWENADGTEDVSPVSMFVNSMFKSLSVTVNEVLWI